MTSVREACFARILGQPRQVAPGEKRAVGAGFVIDGAHVLTCAHVINAAIARHVTSLERPTAQVQTDMPDIALGTSVSADVVDWALSDRLEPDIALLRTDSLPPGCAPAPMALMSREQLLGREVHVRGFPPGYELGYGVTAKVRLSALVGPFIQVIGAEASGKPISDGFSGSPVWDDDLDAVVGMV